MSGTEDMDRVLLALLTAAEQYLRTTQRLRRLLWFNVAFAALCAVAAAINLTEILTR